MPHSVISQNTMATASGAKRTSTINDTLGTAMYDPQRVSTVMSHTPTGNRSDVSGDWDENDGQLPPDPADLFLERIRGWRNLLHVLVQQFQEQASVEKGYLKSTEKSLGLWQTESTLERDLAFGTDQNNMVQFMSNIREYAHRLGQEHEASYRVLTGQTIPTLQAIDRDASNKASTLTSERRSRMKQRIKDEKKLRVLVQSLQKSLASHKGTNGAYSVFQTGDPWLNNLAVRKHLYESIHRHLKTSQSQEGTDVNFSIWEANAISNIKASLSHYTALSGDTSLHASTGFLREAINTLNAEATWSAFRDNRLDAAQSRDGPAVHYSGHSDDFVRSIKEGPIMRKSKLTKSWKEAYWVITSAGWLHEFKKRPTLDGHAVVKPNKSIWLRSCTLTPLGGLTDGLPAEFHLVERADKAGGLSTKKGKTHKYMMETVPESQIWWNVLSDFASGALGYTNKYQYDERSQSRLTAPASRQQTLSPTMDGMPQRAHSVASTASSYPSSLAEEQNLGDDVSDSSSIRETGEIGTARAVNSQPAAVTSTTVVSATEQQQAVPAIVEPVKQQQQQSTTSVVTDGKHADHSHIAEDALAKLNEYRNVESEATNAAPAAAPAAESGLTTA